MKLKEQQTTMLAPELLEQNDGQILGLPRNPRRWADDAVDKLKASIQQDPEFLQYKPLLCYPRTNEQGETRYVVVGGNMRLYACRALGLQSLPCLILPEDTTAEKLQRLTLKDNASFGEWDWDALATWDDDLLKDCDITLPDNITLEETTPEELPDTYDEENDAEPDIPVEPGDVWQLGEHRLLCGDSTSADDVARLMGADVADLVFTDPPYGMGKECDGVENDNQNADDLLQFNRAWIPLSFGALKPNGSWYCWGTEEPLMDIYAFILKPMIREQLITWRNLIVWDKGDTFGMNSPEMRSYPPTGKEKCIFVQCGVAGYNNNADNYFEGFDVVRLYLDGEAKRAGLTPKACKEITGCAMFSHWFTTSQFAFITRKHYEELHDALGAEYFAKPYDELRKEYEQALHGYENEKSSYYATRAYFDNTHEKMCDVWHDLRARYTDNESRVNDKHATPKPLSICRRAIKSSSRPGELVLDLFGGSGSTLIACEQDGRRCRIMELQPHYCSVIIKRWEEATKQKAVKLQ